MRYSTCKYTVTLKPGLRSLEIIECDAYRSATYDFLLTFHSNHRPFPSVLWNCWLGDRKGTRRVRNWMLVCCWWQFNWSFTCLTAPVVTITSVILGSNKIQNEDILVPADPGSPGKWPLKRNERDSNHRAISYRFREKRWFPSKIATFSHPVYFAPRWLGSSWNCVSAHYVRKTHMMGLPEGPKVLTPVNRLDTIPACDGQTGDGKNRPMQSVARVKCVKLCVSTDCHMLRRRFLNYCDTRQSVHWLHTVHWKTRKLSDILYRKAQR